MTKTERKREESRRVIRIRQIVERIGPTTLTVIAVELEKTGISTVERNLRIDIDVLVEEGDLIYDRDAKIVRPVRPFPHRGGVDVFLSHPFPGQ